MTHQEKKYRVDSFDDILRKLKDAGAVAGEESKSEHYYTHQPSNDVVKLVVHGDTPRHGKVSRLP